MTYNAEWRKIRRDRTRRCDDCGHTIAPTRVVSFLGGMLYTVCADHEREYRGLGYIFDIAWANRDYGRLSKGRA